MPTQVHHEKIGRRLAMPYCRFFYHLVWSTRQRAPLLAGPLRDLVYRAMVAKAKELGGIVYAIGGTADHVHLVVAIPSSIAVATFIGQVKGYSSHFASRAGLAPGQPLRYFAWQGEYGALTFDERALNRIIRYVRRQEIHHAARNGTRRDLEREE
jgi:putative transposase